MTSDPLTAAGLAALAREVSGCPGAVALPIGRRWGVWPSVDTYTNWLISDGSAQPLCGLDAEGYWQGYATEVEALAAVILGAA